MGLFSKLRNSTPKVDNRLTRSVLMPSVMTMISDGSVDDGELAQLANLCSFSPIFSGQSGETTMEMIKSLAQEIITGDLQALLDQAKNNMTMEMRETAVLFAMRIAMADGRIDDGERKALLVLGQHFEIPENKFMVMFEVIGILQRAPEQAA